MNDASDLGKQGWGHMSLWLGDEQVAVREGDVVRLGEHAGLVEVVTLRFVQLRDYDGNVQGGYTGGTNRNVVLIGIRPGSGQEHDPGRSRQLAGGH